MNNTKYADLHREIMVLTSYPHGWVRMLRVEYQKCFCKELYEVCRSEEKNIVSNCQPYIEVVGWVPKILFALKCITH